MDDAIGEVLAQRKALERGAGAGIALSVMLHAAITAAAVYAALRTPREQSVPVIDIQFAKMPAPVAAPEPQPAPPAGGLKPAAPQKPQPQPVVAAPKPVATPPAKTVPLSPFGKSPKKGAEQPSAPATEQPAAASAIEIPVGGTGAVVEGDFPYSIYIDRMRTLVGQHWYRPQAALGIATTVHFVIERDGTIRDARNESESGNGAFDRAALRAILESSPLPPLPFGYNGTYLGVHLTFK